MAAFYRMSDDKCAIEGRKVMTSGQVNCNGDPMFEGWEWVIEEVYEDQNGVPMAFLWQEGMTNVARMEELKSAH